MKPGDFVPKPPPDPAQDRKAFRRDFVAAFGGPKGKDDAGPG